MKILRKEEIGSLAESLCKYSQNNDVEVILSFGKRFDSDIRIEIRNKETFATLSREEYTLDDTIGAEEAMNSIIKGIEGNKQIDAY